ncbi:MAG TPA: PQQ-binding-like beta-propeller repeat protein [Vicinamibacterales bacterium]|nr:PQQ-binding-like beta-propeller repeat protein [Vicinamibacterales bacterium]
MLRTFAILAAVVALAAGILYQFFGLRVVLDGGGTPHLRLVEPSDRQAARIERHREEQRAEYAKESHSDSVAVTPPAAASVEPVAGVSAPAASSTSPATISTRNASLAPPYWTDFRGPRRDGEYREQPILTAWPPGGLKPLWKQPSGGGYASFTIANGRAFTIEQRGAEEVVAAYEVATGRELWKTSWRGEFKESMGGDGPRATPTWAGGRVFALGAEGELRALDEATGRTAWRTNILQDAGVANLSWGMAASPLVVDEVVVTLPGGPNGHSVVAYDRASGRRVWQTLDDQQSYASPALVTLAGVRQILVFTADRLVAIGPNGGEPLWSVPWPGPNRINAAQPLVIGDNRVFISSGYGIGAAVVEVSKGPSGFSVREIWRNTRMKNRFASSVLHDGFIYGLDESILTCLDAATGEPRWKGGRYGYGQLILASGHLIVLTEEGDLVLVRATPARLEEVARFPALSGKTWNPPAIGGGFLLVRNLAEMAGFDVTIRK